MPRGSRRVETRCPSRRMVLTGCPGGHHCPLEIPTRQVFPSEIDVLRRVVTFTLTTSTLYFNI